MVIIRIKYFMDNNKYWCEAFESNYAEISKTFGKVK